MEPPEIAASMTRVFAALRLMLATFGADNEESAGTRAFPDVTALQSAVQALDSPVDRYQLVAHLAMLVRWASSATGRSEADVVAILEHKDPSDIS